MKIYRVKKQAVPFINEKYVSKVYDLETWEKIGLDINALEQVEPAYISYGIKSEDNSSLSTTSGWSAKNGSKFCFTINFPSLEYLEYNKFCKERNIRDLMDKIQNFLNNHMTQFLNEEQTN